jgi:hypothetical protein
LHPQSCYSIHDIQQYHGSLLLPQNIYKNEKVHNQISQFFSISHDSISTDELWSVFFGLILYLYFRQVDPSINAAPRALSECIQQRNIRKVKVNAQIAFAIYIFEIVGWLSIILIHFCFGKMDFFRAASLLLYYVLLPYIYLLNTSNNKDRITDEGWWNTVLNALGMSTNNVTETHSQSQKETFNMPTCRARAKNSKKCGSNIERTNAAIGQVGGNEQNSGIYTVSYNKKENFILEVKASSSNGKSEPSIKQHEVNHLNFPHSDDSDDDSSTPQRSRCLHLAEKILFEMMMNVDKEEVYIHYLKQLLLLGMAPILDDFKILEFSPQPAPTHGKIKSSKQNTRVRSNPDELEKSKNQKPELVELNVQRHLDRLDLRKSTLQNYQDHCKDDEEYKIFFDKLFDFEESLFMEHHKS